MDLTNNSLPQLSYWELKYLNQKFDYIIVGGGICGLFTAYFLVEQNPEAKIVVLEKQAFGNKASTKNAGFACFGSVGEILDDIELLGVDRCFELLEMRLKGLKILRNNIPDSAMNFEFGGAYEVFTHDEMEIFRNKILPGMAEVNRLFKHILPKPYTLATAPSPLKSFEAGIFQAGEGCLNPYNLMRYLEKRVAKLGVVVLKATEVVDYMDHGDHCSIQSSLGTLQAKQLIINTNLNVFEKKLPKIKTSAARAQVLVSEALNLPTNNAVFHAMAGYTYFRFIDNRLLLGGLRHRFLTEENTVSSEVSKALQQELHEYGQQILGSKFKVAHAWAGTMSVGDNRFPIIGRQGNVSYGLKMGGMGVAIGAYVGKKLSELSTLQ